MLITNSVDDYSFMAPAENRDGLATQRLSMADSAEIDSTTTPHEGASPDKIAGRTVSMTATANKRDSIGNNASETRVSSALNTQLGSNFVDKIGQAEIMMLTERAGQAATVLEDQKSLASMLEGWTNNT